MANENESMNQSQDESAGSNGDTDTTSPSTGGQCSYPITKISNKQTSHKHPQQGPTHQTLASPPQRPLSINPNVTTVRVLRTNANRTNAEVVRSLPPPPRTKGTTSLVPLAPRPASFWRNNNNASGSGSTSRMVQVAPRPARFWARTNVTGSGASLYHFHRPYKRNMHHEPPKTVDYLSRMEGVGSQPSNPRQRDQELLSIADFLAHIHNNPWKTVDFLSQMEAATLAPLQVRRERPTTETLVQWASSLTIGNGRSRNVDLLMPV